MKHTQDKWSFRKKDEITREAIIDCDGELFAFVNFPMKKDQKNVEVNARLMAAAPDLLDACKDGLKFLDSMTSGIGFESEKQNKAAFRRILKQAIAKAE